MQDQIQPSVTEPSRPTATRPPSFSEKNKLLIKASIVGFLILFLLIPQMFVRNLIEERKDRQQNVEQQITTLYSDSQTFAGPIIAIPYRNLHTNTDTKGTYATKEFAYIMPDQLNIDSKVTPGSKRISLFNVSTYDASIKATGNFKNDYWSKLGISPADVNWSEARVLIGISDFKGLKEELKVNWDGQTIIAEPGFEDHSVLKHALALPLLLNADNIKQPHTFDFTLQLRGTKNLNFIPVANNTAVDLHTNWATPGFTGNYPAVYNPDFATKPLDAKWNVLSINRSFPQYWAGEPKDINKDWFGLSFVQPIDQYAKTIRSVKYALLVILLTFAVYFFIEVLQKKSAHAIQYVLVGFALIIFYLLLLSIAEYIGFNAAYGISALATITLIATYTKSVFHHLKTSMVFAGFLGFIYLFIFILIQLEDSALLIGSIGLFAILAGVMYISKKINWLAHQ
jgi:inner membrane protein